MRKYTKNKPTFPSEESLAKSLFLGILKLEKKWTTKVNWVEFIHSWLSYLMIGCLIVDLSFDPFTQFLGCSPLILNEINLHNVRGKTLQQFVVHKLHI